MKLLLANRPDLAGLPFIIGGGARVDSQTRSGLGCAVLKVRQGLGPDPEQFWKCYGAALPSDRFAASALVQILATEAPLEGEPAVSSGFRQKLVLALARNFTDEATRGLARVAIFSVEGEVRRAAIAVLKNRDTRAATGVLREGLRYPWPAVARNATAALVALGRADLAFDLVNMLEASDPRAPVRQRLNGEDVCLVRDLVRVNHQRNCLLCHPSGNTPDVVRRTIVVEQLFADEDVARLTAEVPLPGYELPRRETGYSPFDTLYPDNLVRADITYLRPDFSRLQKIKDAPPWPSMQRFDYLVRERLVTVAEGEAYASQLAARSDAADHRRMVLSALGGLTGLDAGQSASAWRTALWSEWARDAARRPPSPAPTERGSLGSMLSGAGVFVAVIPMWLVWRKRRWKNMGPRLP